MKVRDLTYVSVMAAVLCVVSPFSFSIGTIPISLATLGVYMAGMVLGRKKGSLAILIYILLGAVGLPVFSGFEGGLGKIAGVTGGYLIGYIFCGFIVGIMTEKIKKVWVYPLSMVLGTAVCYAFGTAWFAFQTNTGFLPALAVCVLPFLIGDAIKIAAATILGIRVKNK